jgi:branched-chain amino acid transport system ATP-binding protein
MTAIEPTILELDRITAGYHGHTVLRGVSVGVSTGSVVALLGPNGAGKTTLLRVASGLLKPAAGRVSLLGADLTRAAADERVRRGMCLIPEGRGIFRSLSVEENLRLFTPPWAGPDGLERALSAFPALKDRLANQAGSLSGGQQQMLALTRLYLARPRVALLDEVSLGLAPIVVDEIFEALSRLPEDGVSLLLVEQYVNRALRISDHVFVINRGQITFSGKPDLLDEQTLLRGYLQAGSDADTDTSARVS